MLKRPGRTLLILVSFTLIVLCSGILLRGMIIRDLPNYLANERMILLIWSLLITGLALGMGRLLSRKPEGASTNPDTAAVTDSNTDKNKAALVPAMVDAVLQSETRKEVSLPAKSKANKAAMKEEEPEAEPDDLLDADDEDMQPLPGDADRITLVVKGMEKLARAQELRRSLQKEPLELAQFLNRIIEKTRATVQSNEVQFSLECASDLKVSVDPACLSGIMENLLDNAMKAVKKNGTVTVSAAADGDHVVLAIKDTGTGIRRKNIPHLFEQFYRGAGSGIGLGLTIVKELVDACGGTIDVQSARGKGSIFRVSIPPQ